MLKNITVNKELPIDIIKQYKNNYNTIGYSPSIDFLKIVTNNSQVISSEYVPEDVQYDLIEPVLNNRSFCTIYNDKNFYERFLGEYSSLFPDVIIRSINYNFYTKSYESIAIEQAKSVLLHLEKNKLYIVKPSIETGGGENVASFSINKEQISYLNNTYNVEDFFRILCNKFNGSYIIQKIVLQHQYFAQFNKSSVNTIRLFVYRSVNTNEIHPLHAYIRYGAKGSIVDSSSQGGRTCGIDLDSGLLNNFSITKHGKVLDHKDTNLSDIDRKVPFFNKIQDIAKSIAPLFPYHHLLGFDFCVDNNGNIRIFEVNNLYIGVINQQMSTGPLYKEFYQEILSYCSKNKKTYNINFKI